jgi:hypothetical protein
MTDCNPNWTPAVTVALGSDPDGAHYDQAKWNYASIVGMLLYLRTNTCPDIALLSAKLLVLPTPLDKAMPLLFRSSYVTFSVLLIKVPSSNPPVQLIYSAG